MINEMVDDEMVDDEMGDETRWKQRK